jgi:hypothetical protein
MTNGMSMTLSDPEILSFAAAVLERHGGLIEPAGERLLALMPPALAQSLELPEEIELGSEAAPLLYGSPLLDRLVGLATREVPVAYGQIEIPYLKKAGFDQLLERDLAFAGAQVRLSSRAEARATYMILFCHYVALSDERKEGLVTLGVHEASGAVIPGLANQWEAGLPRFFPAGQVPSHFPMRLEAALSGALKSARTVVATELRGFLAGMQRRLGRDVKNTREYYAALRQEMEAGLSHSNLTKSQRQERLSKIAGLPEELARKIADLEQKYQVRVTVSAGGALRFLVDVVHLLLELKFHRLTRSCRAVWNPLTRSLDPMVCENCQTTMLRAYPTAGDLGLKLLCLACSQKKN